MGFGMKIITASIERQLGGRVAIDWHAEGVSCRFWVPREKLKVHEPPQPVVRSAAPIRPMPLVSNKRVMIVEDEALVPLAMAESLQSLGLCVVGPFTKVSEALAALDGQLVDAAVLDVNLVGEMVYPLADTLCQRGVPFIFVTGYSAESIDKRFQHVPVLQKPIEQEILKRLFIIDENSIQLSFNRPRSGLEMTPAVPSSDTSHDDLQEIRSAGAA